MLRSSDEDELNSGLLRYKQGDRPTNEICKKVCLQAYQLVLARLEQGWRTFHAKTQISKRLGAAVTQLLSPSGSKTYPKSRSQ